MGNNASRARDLSNFDSDIAHRPEADGGLRRQGDLRDDSATFSDSVTQLNDSTQRLNSQLPSALRLHDSTSQRLADPEFLLRLSPTVSDSTAELLNSIQ